MSRVVVDEIGDTKEALTKMREDTKNELTMLRQKITLIMDNAKKDILHMLETSKYFLTDRDYLQADSRYLLTGILRDRDYLRAKLQPQKPLPSPPPPPPLPDVAGKNHTRRHKKKRGKKTRNNRN